MSARAFHLRAGRWPVVLRPAGLLAGAILLLLAPLAGVASAATIPTPAPGQVPGVATQGGGVVMDAIAVFYQRAADHGLTVIGGSTSGSFGTPMNLGGVLTSGPAAIVRQPPIEFFDEAVFVRGADNAIWYRMFSDGQGVWLAWTRLGGRALGAPTVTCLSPTSPMIVYVRGGNGALWRRPLNAGWTSLGGVLASDPSALPAVRGQCPSREDIFALGTDRAVWERVAGAWHRVGGRSTVAPTAVQLAGGETDLFVRGTDNALWMNTRASGATVWAGWRRIGGILTSAPAANVFPSSPQIRVVFALGADGNLWRGRNVVGSVTWRWSQVP